MITIMDGRNVPAVSELKVMMEAEWFLSYTQQSRPELTSRAAYEMFDSITTK